MWEVSVCERERVCVSERECVCVCVREIEQEWGMTGSYISNLLKQWQNILSHEHSLE